MFIAQLLDCMEIKVYYPITVQVDSVGVILCLKISPQQVAPIMLTSDINLSMNVKDGVIKIIFRKYHEIDSNIMTKNLSRPLHHTHVRSE